MFPVIEVQCPFCKTTGQIMAPPLGSIVVGPCPRCNEMVLLYDGTVMPLDKEIIAEGTAEEKKHHLLETIVEMVAVKVDELIESGTIEAEPKIRGRKRNIGSKRRRIFPSVTNRNAAPISRDEIRDFINIDLHLIDSKDYFDKIFRKKKKS
jgi:phage FluMu protein Com